MMPVGRHLGFQRVIFDCDSTLTTVEGIDELARLKGQTETIARLTSQAMDGQIPLEQVYAKRLELLQPTRAELVRVGRIYRRTLVPYAEEVIAALQEAGVEVFIVSGGLKAAVLDLAAYLKVPADHVHAVSVEMDQLQGDWWDYLHHRYGNPDERYLDFAPTPLAESNGKLEVVMILGKDKRTLMVGDGSTDLATKDAVRLFVGFGGVERRQSVVDGAEVFVEGPGLEAILPLALSTRAAELLLETDFKDVYLLGRQAVLKGRVRFKEDVYRERVLKAHPGPDHNGNLLTELV
ncbi:MAG: HAD-IB family phosphatase [Anaerolineales bacterium]|nr:HAD-IB family phosphatase [Anaerolineales bacterium]